MGVASITNNEYPFLYRETRCDTLSDYKPSEHECKSGRRVNASALMYIVNHSNTFGVPIL